MTIPAEEAHVEAPLPKSNPRWLIPCGCVTVLLLFIALPVLALLIASGQSARRVEQQLAKLRAAGEPTTLAELAAAYKVPENVTDTTELWTEAIRLLDEGNFEQYAKDLPIVGSADENIPLPGEPWDQLEAAEKLLDQFREALDAMHAAGRLEHGSARFDLRFEDGFGMKLVQEQKLRDAARLISLEAHVQAHRGNTEGVVESLRSLLAAADAVENEPILVSQLIRIALIGIAVSNCCELLPKCDFTDAQLDALSIRFAQCERPQGLTVALRGERVLGMDTIRDPAKADIRMPISPMPFMNDNLNFHIVFLNQAVEASQRPFPEALDEIAKSNNELKSKLGQGGIQKLRYAVAAMLVPAFDAAFSAVGRDMAYCRMVRILIAVEKFQRREGRFPRDLNELTPGFLEAVPLDPGDGKPLRYVATETECKVYSVGRNRVDDGGQTVEMKDDVLVLKRRTSPVRQPASDEASPAPKKAESP